MASCVSCHNPLPAGASACESCGQRVGAPVAHRKTVVESSSAAVGHRVTRMEPQGSPPVGHRETRIEPPVSPPANRASGGSPFDRSPKGSPFDRAPQPVGPRVPTAHPGAVAPPRHDPAGETLAAVLVAYRAPDDPGTLHRLRFGKNAIGRASSSDIALDDPTVSEHHGFVYVDPGSSGGRFLDVSSNGSLVDGVRVNGAQADLVSGTTLLVGSTVLVFTLLQPPAATVWGLR